MGREIKRVVAGFDWPLEETWKGYLNPYRCQQCPQCKNGCYSDGLTPKARVVADSFYDLDWAWNCPSPHRWCDKLLQEEVNLLVDEGRLADLAQTWAPDEGWKPKLNEDGSRYYPTAEEVNAWER